MAGDSVVQHKERRSMTEHARMVLRIKQSGVGDFWICLELLEKKLKVLKKEFLSFDVPGRFTWRARRDLNPQPPDP